MLVGCNVNLEPPEPGALTGESVHCVMDWGEWAVLTAAQIKTGACRWSITGLLPAWPFLLLPSGFPLLLLLLPMTMMMMLLLLLLLQAPPLTSGPVFPGFHPWLGIRLELLRHPASWSDYQVVSLSGVRQVSLLFQCKLIE